MSLGKIYDIDEDASITAPIIDDALIRLDIACGSNKKDAFTGIDISPDCQADIVYDLESYPWPFEDNSVFEAHCSHYIEHTKDIKNFMTELWRILIPGGHVEIQAPYWSSKRAMQDFTHTRFISENTFLYFVKTWIDANKLSHYDINCNFAIMSIKYLYSTEWRTRSEETKNWAREHYNNVVDDIIVVLKALK